MFAGDRAAHAHAGLQDVGAEELAAAPLLRITGIVEDQRMQVAVPRVKHIDAAEPILMFHGLNRAQHLSQALPGYRRVHAHVVRTDPAGGRERIFAPAPESQALRFARADLDACRAALPQHLCHAPDLFIHLEFRAVAFAKQYRGCGKIVACVHERFSRGRHAFVHEFKARRDDAIRDDARDRRARGLDIRVACHDAARDLRSRNQTHGHFCGHRKHALAADND